VEGAAGGLPPAERHVSGRVRQNSWYIPFQANAVFNAGAADLGDMNNVVFSCGAVFEDYTGNVKVYYGAADTCICVGTAKLDELLDCCTPV